MVGNIEFQFYPANIEAKKPLGTLTLKSLANGIKNPKEAIKNLFNQIVEATDKGDLKLKNTLKEGLFFFIPSVITDGQARGYDNIVSYNPLAVVEYDKLSLEEANYLKYKIFYEFPECCMAFLSPSKSGVKFIFKIDLPKSVEEYKEYFFGLVYYLEQIKEGVDLSNERVTQPLFLSWDSELLYREEPSSWSKRGRKIGALEENLDLEGYECESVATESEIKLVLDRLKSFLDKVDDDGHNNLLKCATLAGGYISGWGIPEQVMIDFFENEIENHPYFKKGINNYKKTARTFIKRGQKVPLVKN